jgi:TetR/AcrR family transcriptional regulator, transcriptional repressor for nem operon
MSAGQKVAPRRREQADKMGRPREFDESAVLDAVVECFWTRGYELTSIRDLIDGTGITGASLYNAFGDKRSLFQHALDRYLNQSIRQLMDRLEVSVPPRQAVEALLREVVERSLTDKRGRGCMLVNSALEVAHYDPEFSRMIGDALGEIEGFFRRCIEAGQADKTIAKDQQASDLARHLLGVLLGVRVVARTRPRRAQLEGMIAPALSCLIPFRRPKG